MRTPFICANALGLLEAVSHSAPFAGWLWLPEVEVGGELAEVGVELCQLLRREEKQRHGHIDCGATCEEVTESVWIRLYTFRRVPKVREPGRFFRLRKDLIFWPSLPPWYEP